MSGTDSAVPDLMDNLRRSLGLPERLVSAPLSDDAIIAALAEALDDTATGLWMAKEGGPGWGRVVADRLLPTVRQLMRRQATEVLRAAAQEQRNEAEQVPWDDEGTHADGHRCAAWFLDQRVRLTAERNPE